MNSWWHQSQEESNVVWKNGYNDPIPNKKPWPGEYVQESVRGSHNITPVTLENFSSSTTVSHSQERFTCIQSLCASVSRSKADMSSGEETLEIGYCITGAIYLFWGLTYLIPLLNPVGVNSPRISNDLTKCNAEGVRAFSLFWKWD